MRILKIVKGTKRVTDDEDNNKTLESPAIQHPYSCRDIDVFFLCTQVIDWWSDSNEFQEEKHKDMYEDTSMCIHYLCTPKYTCCLKDRQI